MRKVLFDNLVVTEQSRLVATPTSVVFYKSRGLALVVLPRGIIPTSVVFYKSRGLAPRGLALCQRKPRPPLFPRPSASPILHTQNGFGYVTGKKRRTCAVEIPRGNAPRQAIQRKVRNSTLC